MQGNYKKNRVLGPGGINCPCCTPWGSKKETKDKLNRAVRRSAKVNLRNDHEEDR